MLTSVVDADRIPQAGTIDRAMFGYYGMKTAGDITSVPGATLADGLSSMGAAFHLVGSGTVRRS